MLALLLVIIQVIVWEWDVILLWFQDLFVLKDTQQLKMYVSSLVWTNVKQVNISPIFQMILFFTVDNIILVAE